GQCGPPVLTPARRPSTVPRSGLGPRRVPRRWTAPSGAAQPTARRFSRARHVSRPQAGAVAQRNEVMQTTPVPPGDSLPLDLSRIAQDLQIRKVQVESVVQLLDEGNTIPFITRYRKERTGGLDEEVLRIIQERVGQLRQLAERKQTILKSIDHQGKLT